MVSEVVRVFRKGKLFAAGWIYFALMFALASFLPPWTGVENGVIENLQLVCLAAGGVFCWRMRGVETLDWGGSSRSLWSAGAVVFFLAFMREISWGRVFFVSEATGRIVKTSELGVYGTLIHVAVGTFIALALFLLYRAKAWRVLRLAKLTMSSFALLLLFIAVGRIGELIERGKIGVPFVYGQVLEELAELGAYIVALKLTTEAGSALGKLKGKE